MLEAFSLLPVPEGPALPVARAAPGPVRGRRTEQSVLPGWRHIKNIVSAFMERVLTMLDTQTDAQ